MIFNIYCDESCHLEKDNQRVMVLGAIWCPKEKVRDINIRLREIKKAHGINPSFEIKWTKVSASQKLFYLALLDYFFDNDDLHFRALIVPDKGILNHAAFEQDHNTWYYKMYFNMLKVILDPKNRYYVYIDIKDTRGASKIKKLHEVLCRNIYDFALEIIKEIQLIRSHEVEILQLADLLIGIISYANRKLSTNAGKVALVERMRQRSNYTLQKSTLYREDKVNILRWQPAESD